MRKIIAILLALTLIPVMCVSASQNAKIENIDVNLENDIVTVNVAGCDEEGTLIVLNPGFEDTTVQLPDKALQNISVVENGKYSFELDNPTFGEYKIYLNGTYQSSFYYEDCTGVADIIIQLAKENKVTDLSAYLETDATKKALSIYGFAPIESKEINIDKTKMVALFIKTVNNTEINGDDKAKIGVLQDVLKTVATIELLNQAKDLKYSFNADGTFVYDDYIKVSTVDKDGANLYNYYINGEQYNNDTCILTNEGKIKVQNKLLNKNIETKDELYKFFMEAVATTGVNNSQIKGATGTKGYAHVNLILTSANKTKIGVVGNITGFIASKLVGTTTDIVDVAALNSLITQYASLESQQNSGSTGGGGGGGGAAAPGTSAGGTLTVTPVDNVDALKQNDASQSENYKYNFSDIAEVEWAIKAIETLSAKGIINGMGDRKFNPSGTVTREQFVKMLCVALNLTEEAEISFTDIAEDDWSVPYIKKAVKAGLISGIDANTFGYGVGISRQDIAVILHRTLNDKKGTASFNDADDIADYAKDAVGALTGLKILNGFEDGSFRPNDSCTRAQAAVIIYNYLNR